ncbi:MAG: response regulator transcription factor [Planctomycetes bacterium]|nr:response regulator transcription factor [Planctomycetota bacterium]
MENGQPPSPGESAATRVYLLVDSSMLRVGLEQLLRRGGVDVVGVSSDPREALTRVPGLAVDVLLVDLRKPGGEGFEWGIRLREALAGTPVLVVRENPAPDQVRLALEAGVECVLAPDEDPAELFIALDALRRGRTYLSPRLLPHFQAHGMEVPREYSRQSLHLSRLEIELVRQLALGHTAREAALACEIPESTASELIAAVSSKLECRSAADFARFAIREGFLPRAD